MNLLLTQNEMKTLKNINDVANVLKIDKEYKPLLKNVATSILANSSRSYIFNATCEPPQNTLHKLFMKLYQTYEDDVFEHYEHLWNDMFKYCEIDTPQELSEFLEDLANLFNK